MVEDKFRRSIALFDAAGKLIDWDDGLAVEWGHAAPYLKPGATYGDLLRVVGANPRAREFLAGSFGSDNVDQAIEAWIAGFGQERTIRHMSGGRIFDVRERPSHEGRVWRTAHEITKEKLTEDALEQARHQLQAASSETGSAFVEMRRRPDGSYGFSPIGVELQRLLRFPAAWVGCDSILYLSRIRQVDGAFAQRSAMLEQAARTMKTCEFEYQILDGDNRLRWIRQSMLPRREADGSILFSGVIRDVSREKQAEEQVELLRSVVVRSGVATMILETDGAARNQTRILYVNPKFEELYAVQASDIIGQNPEILLNDPHDSTLYEAVTASLRRADGEPIEVETRNRAGAAFWMEVRTEIVEKFDDGAFRWVMITRDITERRQAKAQLMRAKDAAESGTRAKSNFLAKMNHELRTPLNAILGFAELLQHMVEQNGWKDSYASYFTDIIDSGRHLLDMVNSVLDFSRMEAGAFTLDLDVVNLRELVRSSIGVVHGLAETGEIDLRADLPDDSLNMTGDFLKLKQVILNLASNAIKFTPPGGSVTIASSATSDSVEITVSDTGCGIPEGDLARAMEPFVQIENPVPRKVSGTGLGLPIAREICVLHGGDLEMESVVGKGTTARIRLPRGLPPG